MNIGSEYIRNILWSIVGQFLFMLILFLSNFVLARELDPSDFGRVGVVLFFINVFNVLVEGGLGGALIRKSVVSKKDYETLFIFNFCISLGLYFILFILAPYIARFYEDPLLEYLCKICGLSLIINSFQISQMTKLIKDLQFKRLYIYKTVSALLAAISSIIALHMLNFGLWAIVVLQMSNIFFVTALLNLRGQSVYSFSFDKQSFKSLYKFGINTTSASILSIFFDNLYSIVLTKYFSLQAGGFFYQAKKIIDVPQNVINSLNQGVVFASLSGAKHENDKFLKLYDSTFRNYSFILGFVCVALYLFASDIVIILLGEHWIGTDQYISVFSLISFFYLLEQFNRILYKMYDMTGLILKLELIKKIIHSITVILGIYLVSVEVLLFGYLLTSIIGYLVNYFVSKQKIDVVSTRELFTVLKILLFSFVIVLTLSALHSYSLFFRGLIFMLIYLVGGRVFNLFTFFKRDSVR